jgi:hypothetical protein
LATGWFVVVLKRMIFSDGGRYGDQEAYAEFICMSACLHVRGEGARFE